MWEVKFQQILKDLDVHFEGETFKEKKTDKMFFAVVMLSCQIFFLVLMAANHLPMIDYLY